MILSTQWDAVRWNNSSCFKPACGGGGGEVAHFENDTASKNRPRITTPYPNLMNLVSNYLEINILSNTPKSMVFNQPCLWNNGSNSLHSFWATPYCFDYIWYFSIKYFLLTYKLIQKRMFVSQKCDISVWPIATPSVIIMYTVNTILIV